MATHRQVRLLAQVLDEQGKPEQPITVFGSRRYLVKWFKPEKRGGALRAGGHELVIVPRAPRQEIEPESIDWVEAARNEG